MEGRERRKEGRKTEKKCSGMDQGLLSADPGLAWQNGFFRPGFEGFAGPGQARPDLT